jgi:hypothetical protein
MTTGKVINSMIDYKIIKECKSLREYTVLFQVQLQKIQDTSDAAKLSRSRMSGKHRPFDNKLNIFNNNNHNNKNMDNNNNMEKFNKFGNNNNNKFGNNNNRFGNNNNNNMGNNNESKNRQITPYRNPYEGRLHHVSDAEILGEYHNKCDVDDYDDYIRNKHDYSHNNNENDI